MVASCKDRFTLGELVVFLVTVADLGVWNIGAAFWSSGKVRCLLVVGAARVSKRGSERLEVVDPPL